MINIKVLISVLQESKSSIVNKNNSLPSLVLPALLINLLLASCMQNTDQQKATKIRLLQDERWWGDAVVDGRNSLYSDSSFIYDQNGDRKGNQAQPLFLSNKGRYIWS